MKEWNLPMVLQLGGDGPSSLQSRSNAVWFPSLWTLWEAPYWQGSCRKCWHESSYHLLATDTWNWCLLYLGTDLGATVGLILKCQWWLCGCLFATHVPLASWNEDLVLSIRVYVTLLFWKWYIYIYIYIYTRVVRKVTSGWLKKIHQVK